MVVLLHACMLVQDLPLEFVADPEMLQDLHERRLSITLLDAISDKPFGSTFVAGDATQEAKVELHGFCKEPLSGRRGCVCV